MQWSYSRIDTASQCHYKYYLRYIQKLEVLPPDDAGNALILGKAMHTGLQFGVEAAIKEYYAAYPIITDEHVIEAMKLEILIPKARALLPDGGEFEFKINAQDVIGYIDYVTDDAIYDFKYTSDGLRYKESMQLHLYKNYYDGITGNKINNLYYLIIPKIKNKIKNINASDSAKYINGIYDEAQKAEPMLMPIAYDPNYVIEFFLRIKRISELQEYEKQKTYLCNYCEYKKYCQEGENYMILPKNERREIEGAANHSLWIYGAPFTGKTTFANEFPDPLMINTDGNTKFVDAPVIRIKDELEKEGRITKKTFAWANFKDTIDLLESKENTFKTIVIDLLEDLYEQCRLFMYDKLNITHESDDSFKAWDKVTTEFLSTIKRVMALDYENIVLISHEDTTKDITKKSGDKITAIKPNLRDKVATKVAGMVDIVARIIAEGDEHTMSFKTSEVIFGGGRLNITNSEIPLEYSEFLKVYDDKQEEAPKKSTRKPIEQQEKPEQLEQKAPNPEPAPTQRARKRREQELEEGELPIPAPEPQPRVRIRKR